MKGEGFDFMNLVWVFFKCRGKGGVGGLRGILPLTVCLNEGRGVSRGNGSGLLMNLVWIFLRVEREVLGAVSYPS